MNNKRYQNIFYEVRTIKDLRELLNSSADLYTDSGAFLVKDKPGEDYRPVSYGKFREDVNSLGTALVELGLSGKKIAVIGANSYEWVLTYFAVSCGLGTIVPVESELRPDEIGKLLRWVGVAAVVCSGKMEKVVREASRNLDSLEYVICMNRKSHEGNELSLPLLLQRGRQLVGAGRRDYLDANIDPDAMSMLLFTSGTTGVAKGVMLSHSNIVSNIMNMSMYVNVKGYVGLSVLPMHHTYEMTCHILTGLYQGCCLAICEGLKYILKNMAEAKVNVMLGVPLLFESMHKKIFRQAEKNGKAGKLKRGIALSKRFRLYNTDMAKKMFREIHETLGGEMKLLISGAAAIDPKVIEDFTAMGIPMIQGYGMTEHSPIIAVNRDRYSKPSSVGPPMPNTEVRILNPDDQGVGEILSKSASVMLGYYNNPEETEEILSDGWLHTGDYGYIDKKGFLYITGRKKNVIVTKNGKNIFPEEAEFYLTRSDYIAEAIVYGIPDESGGETVVCARIFPDFEQIDERLGKLSDDELHELIRDQIDGANEKMPLYKHIRRFELRYTEFEKTPSRKIKRHAANNNK